MKSDFGIQLQRGYTGVTCQDHASRSKSMLKVAKQTVASVAAIKAVSDTLHHKLTDLARSEVGVGVMWFELCKWIRDTKVPDDVVRVEMDAVGYKRSRISEVLRVCSAPEKVWAVYANRTLGFRKTLQLARLSADGKVSDVTPAAEMVFPSDGPVDKPALLKQVEEVVSAERTADGAGPSRSAYKLTAKSKCERAAQVIFKLSTKPRVWSSGDGWELHLVRCGKVKVAKTSALDNR